MVASLSSIPDALPTRSPFPTFHQRLRSQEALAFLKNCTNFKRLKQIHAKIIRHGLSGDPILVVNLLRLCSSYRKMDYASLLFDQLQTPSTFTWNIMIRGHAITGNALKALLLYTLMIRLGVPPDKFTFPFVIKACIASSAIRTGKEVHVLVIKSGFSTDMFVQNTLMDLYFKCGDSGDGRKVFDKMRVKNVVSWTTVLTGLITSQKLDAARRVFEEMPLRNVVSWTAIIDAYARNGQPQEAFELFSRMQLDNVRPNEFTLVSLLMSSTELGSLKLGRWIHDYAMQNRFEFGPYLGTALIDMYSKCGSLEESKRVFDKMKVRSLATWNSMITSLGVHGRGEEAIALFAQMEKENVQPDAITFVGVLCACVHTGDVNEGVEYFNYMQEHYGIKPLPEHHACMIELHQNANMSGEVSELMNAGESTQQAFTSSYTLKDCQSDTCHGSMS